MFARFACDLWFNLSRFKLNLATVVAPPKTRLKAQVSRTTVHGSRLTTDGSIWATSSVSAACTSSCHAHRQLPGLPGELTGARCSLCKSDLFACQSGDGNWQSSSSSVSTFFSIAARPCQGSRASRLIRKCMLSLSLSSLALSNKFAVVAFS